MANSTTRDWVAWHEDYGKAGTDLSRRLEVVVGLLSEALHRGPSGRLRLLSACAGQGDDVLAVLPTHPRGNDVRALLIEYEAHNVRIAQERVRLAGLTNVDVDLGDAGRSSAYPSIVPADVLLFAGVFGNVPPAHAARTILELRMLSAPGARIIWTRGRKGSVDRTGELRRWFESAGFEEEAFVAPDDATYSVGMHRIVGQPIPFEDGIELFDFL